MSGAEKLVTHPLFAYVAIAALQLRIIWRVWDYRDVTTGDTSSYFAQAMNWAHGAHDNIVWSPLYTNFLGTVALVVGNAATAVMVHRVVIVLTAALLVLALMRALLGPPLGFLVSLWWVVLPSVFNVQYEVHLFGLLPVLVAALVAARSPGRRGRGLVLAILLLDALLLRNEMLLAFLGLGVAVVIVELCERRERVAQTRPSVLSAYAVPLAIVLLLFGASYARSSVRGHQARVAFAAKQNLNVCQIYAFNYQQRYPDRFKGSPWTGCEALMQKTFGEPLPSFTRATRANPGAMADFVAWNAHLLPAGLQIGLFGATAGRDDPDYFPVKTHRLYPLVLSALLLLTVGAGLVLLVRDRAYWWRERLQPRIWSIAVLGAAALTALLVALTQRPRPEYIYALILAVIWLAGLCVAAVARAPGRERVIAFAATAAAFVVVLAFPSYYHPGPRPLHAAIDRLQVAEPRLQEQGSVLATAGYNSEICNYLSRTPTEHCAAPAWQTLRDQVGGRVTFADVLGANDVSVVYADSTLRRDPLAAPLVATPGSFGWRALAKGHGQDGPWSVLVRAGTGGGGSSSATPLVLDHLPGSLSTPGLRYDGIFKDGWIGARARVVLASGPRAKLVLRARVPAAERGPQHVQVLVNGRRVASQRVATGDLDLVAPAPASRSPRRVELRWRHAARIGPNDPRKAAALLLYLGFLPAGAPTEIRFPLDPNAPAPQASGVFTDGWAAKTSSIVLAGGPAADLVVRAQVPPADGQALRISVNGRPLRTLSLRETALDVRVPAPASKGPRKLVLRWRHAARIGPNDARTVAGRIEFLGLFASPTSTVSLPDAGFESGVRPWLEVDGGSPSLTASVVRHARVGSKAVALAQKDGNDDAYVAAVVKGVTPRTTYVVSAWTDVASFEQPALGGRGLFAIGRTATAYDGPTQTSSPIRGRTSGWVRRSVRLTTGPNDRTIELRLYAPRGTTYWDGVRVTPSTASHAPS